MERLLLDDAQRMTQPTSPLFPNALKGSSRLNGIPFGVVQNVGDSRIAED